MVDERSRFAGGLPASVPFFLRLLSGAVDSPSSPEASRDDACIAGGLVEFVSVEVRFRFPALDPPDEGDDMFVIICSLPRIDSLEMLSIDFVVPMESCVQEVDEMVLRTR